MTDLWNKELESNLPTSQLLSRHSKFPAGDNTLSVVITTTINICPGFSASLQSAF